MSEGTHLLSASLSADPSRLARVPFLPTYSAALRDLIKRGVNHPTNYHFPLLDTHIVVDAGNGGGGFFTEQVGKCRRRGGDTRMCVGMGSSAFESPA